METPNSSTFDLSTIDVTKDANTGADVNIYHPGTRADLGIVIKVVGQDSTVFRKISAEQNRRRVARATKGGQFRLNVFSQEELEEDKAKLLASCTMGWNDFNLEGKPYPFSYENAVALYEKYKWIAEQVDEAVGDRALFTKT